MSMNQTPGKTAQAQGGGPTWQVPLADVSFGPEEIAAVTEVLQSGWLSQGPRVERFEAAFAQFLGVKHALAVTNGTAALHLACLALGLGPGDEVLCPALTFVATANAICYTGARPRFVDLVGPHDLNLDPEDAERKITKSTRAIMVVHYGGFAADMAAIQALARRHGLAVIEDCAHAPGAWYLEAVGREKIGKLGTLACFSFFANKNMTTGEGGMVVTDDATLAERLRSGRSHGMTTLTWDRHKGHSFSYDVVAPGYNYRLDEARAALGLVQLERLSKNNARRRALSQHYQEALQEIPQIEIPFLGKLAGSACHILPILLSKEVDRHQFMVYLKEGGIQTSIHYPPVHRFTYYSRLWPPGTDHHLPRTEEVAAREVTLPLFPSMTQGQLQQVIERIQRFFQKT